MVDYIERLKKDLLEQFRGKPNIEALMYAIGRQANELIAFYEQLKEDRGVKTATGKQLDGVGDIAVLSRMEAGQLAGNPIPFDILDDETYRQYLIFKILKNNCDCTYWDIIKAFGMFWERPLYYTEDPEQPATMIFNTGEMQGFVDTRPLFRTPLLRAAGVTLKIYAITSTPMDAAVLHILSGLGYAVTISTHPIIERDYDFQGRLYIGSGNYGVTEDTLPGMERDYDFQGKLYVGSGNKTITQDTLPAAENDYQFKGEVHMGIATHNVMQGAVPDAKETIPQQKTIDRSSAVHSVMETPLGDLTYFK